MGAAQVSVDLALSAFGVPATVRRATPDTTPVSVTGFWVRSLHDEPSPVGVDLQRREPRRIFVMKKHAALETLRRNDIIDAPEESAGPIVRWRVDGLDEVESDCWRAIVVLAR